MESEHAHRKDEHLALAEAEYRKMQPTSSLNQVRLIHNALPEASVNQVNLASNNPDFPWPFPFYIEAMTGGSEKSSQINGQLADVAKETGLAMAVGSQSIALKDFEAIPSFEVARKKNPSGFLIANLGAGHTAYEAQRVINMIDANALEIHINAAQEIVMAEGDRNFHWQESLAEIIATSPVPVIVKEVGFGMDLHAIQTLEALGAKYINVGGQSGTNFARIEDRRNHTAYKEHAHAYLYDWGQTTAESLLEAQTAQQHIFATGGIQSPLDVVKAQVLGAENVGVAGYFLHILLNQGADALVDEIQLWQQHLPKIYTLLGAKTRTDLQKVPFVVDTELANYAQQRHLKLSHMQNF